MTYRLIERMNFVRKLKIGTKAAICAALLIALNTGLVVGAAYWSLSNEFATRARSDIDVNLRTLAQAFGETFGDAKITMRDGTVARAEIATMPQFKDHAIVDRAVSYVGGNATLFALDDISGQFFRRSTNVKKENGDRAVGTTLAGDHPAQAVLRRGEAYKGPAILFGKSFFTAYQPVLGATGKVVGIFYVGIPTAQLDGMLMEAIQTMAIAAGLAALLVLALTMLIVRRITTPLKSVTASLTAIAEGAPDVEISIPTGTTKSGRSRVPSSYSKVMRMSGAVLKRSAPKLNKWLLSAARRICVNLSMNFRQASEES